MIQLSEEQQEVSDAIDSFIEGSYGEYLTTHGLAGTGKSTVLSLAARRHPDSILCTYTGKAAAVLRAKTDLDVFTIHQVIYDFKGLVPDSRDENKRQPIFTAKYEERDLTGRVAFVDECSVVGSRTARDLLATGVRVVTCGDPGQLLPVMDTQFFNEPHLVLHEVHRQAWDSPIIRQAHAIRHTGKYGEDGEGFKISTELNNSLLLGHDIVLCWRNTTRIWLNRRHRKLRNLPEFQLRVGEPVMCLRNDHARKIYNGAIYSVYTDWEPGDDLSIVDDRGQCVVVMNPTIETIDPLFEKHKYEEGFTPLALANACTVHKFQGSEAKSVLLIDEYRQSEGRRAYLYTGVTRGIERVTVIKRW